MALWVHIGGLKVRLTIVTQSDAKGFIKLNKGTIEVMMPTRAWSLVLRRTSWFGLLQRCRRRDDISCESLKNVGVSGVPMHYKSTWYSKWSA